MSNFARYHPQEVMMAAAMILSGVAQAKRGVPSAGDIQNAVHAAEQLIAVVEQHEEAFEKKMEAEAEAHRAAVARASNERGRD